MCGIRILDLMSSNDLYRASPSPYSRAIPNLYQRLGVKNDKIYHKTFVRLAFPELESVESVWNRNKSHSALNVSDKWQTSSQKQDGQTTKLQSTAI